MWSQGSRKGCFITAICGLGDDSQAKEGWVPCDPLAFAAALDSTMIIAADDVLCKVEITDLDKRGQTFFYTISPASKMSVRQHGQYTGSVLRVSKVDVDKFAAMINASTGNQ